MQELARRCFVSKSGISQIVSQLSEQDLVERQGLPDNLRVACAALTPKGEKALEESAPIFLGAVRRHFSGHLNEEEITHLTRITKKLITAHGEPVEGPG